jgi:putative flippase GtrA
VATEAAVLHNFLWHLRWTWADRPAGARAAGWRLLRFNLSNGGFSLVGGAAIMALLVDALGVHYLLANVAAVLVVSIANFLASDRFVFTRAARSGAPASRHTTYKTTAM